jgi:ubiquinone/menaquinone biosynthesis C-methylase UbiE
MKVDDSGMPDEGYWNSLFNIEEIFIWMNQGNEIAPVTEIGCGYGTITVPLARKVTGRVYAFDIDPAMIEKARSNVHSAGIKNVEFHQRDVIEKGTGLPDECMCTVLLFNILHSEHNRRLLKESSRILQVQGSVYIIHWRKDIVTPRGPRVETRPDQHTILDQIGGLDLIYRADSRIIEPYHWGMRLIKGSTHANRNSARDK